MASGVQAEAVEEAKFSPKKARQAVRALLQHVAKVQAQHTAQQLLDDEEQIHLVVGMKRIPQKKETRTNPYEMCAAASAAAEAPLRNLCRRCASVSTHRAESCRIRFTIGRVSTPA